MFDSGIWEREGHNELDKPTYIRAIALFTAISIGLVTVGAYVSFGWQMNWVLLIGAFVAMIAGALTFVLCKDPGLSILGVTVMSIAGGLMSGPVVATYNLGVVIQAVIATAGIVGVMSLAGILYPKIFEGIGPYLLAGLTILIFSQFAQIFFIILGFEQAVDMPILAWIGIAIFALYVAFDWSRALSLPYTLDNAIDAAGAITLDAINIFLRVLQLLGSSSSSSKRR